MSRYEPDVYEEPIYVYELDRIFANPDELASFLNYATRTWGHHFRGIHLEYVEE